MTTWRVDETADGLRLASVTRRALGSEQLTWAELLHFSLSAVEVYALYFPSRFDLPTDAAAREALEAFGRQTGASTSVSFWDPTDPEFGRALGFFDLEAPPVLVLATGLKPRRRRPPDRANVYAIAITDTAVLADREQLARAVNSAHEVLVRGDPKEIAGYPRERAAGSVLAAIGRIAERLRDEIVKLKPKVQLPGGVAIQLG